jgi:hypothetical protein
VSLIPSTTIVRRKEQRQHDAEQDKGADEIGWLMN